MENIWKKRCKKTLLAISSILILWALLVVIVDPYFHFHKPLAGLSYRLYEERYVNDGIGRYFDYDAIITGTSMTQNFKTSEFDSLFQKTSVKMPFSGGGFKEIIENLDRCLSRNPRCTTVLLGLDYYGLIRDWEWNQYEGNPLYLYDQNPFNDVSYLFNKDVMLRGVMTNLVRTFQGEASTTFDEYSAWESDTGLDAIYANGFDRRKEIKPMLANLTDSDEELVKGTIENLLVSIVKKYPNVTFYFFYTPYSIVSFDDLYRDGRSLEQFQAERMVNEALLEHENVRLFEFFENTDLITNLDLYRDKEHYDAKVNSWILQWIAEGEGELTIQNQDAHLAFMEEYYLNYDYDRIFE